MCAMRWHAQFYDVVYSANDKIMISNFSNIASQLFNRHMIVERMEV